MRIAVLLSAAGGGDRQPVIALACALADRGHAVTFVADEATADLVSATELPMLRNGVEQVGFISAWIQQLAESDEPPNPFVEWAQLAYPSVEPPLSDLRPDVIVSSLFTMGLADLLARESATPWCFVNPGYYFGHGQRRAWVEDWHEPFVPRLARECFAPLVDRADLVLHATDPLFDFEPDSLPAGHHYVGFLLWEPAMDVPAIFDTPGDPWALVSASTARPGDEVTMLRASVEGLAGHPVRTVLTVPKGVSDEGLADSAVVTGYVPHGPVLRRSALSVNQASHGIVSKCLVNGVPMVLLPWDADQPGVAARAEALGVAIVLSREDATRAGVSSAAGKILADDTFANRAAEVASELQARTPAATACSILEGALAPGR